MTGSTLQRASFAGIPLDILPMEETLDRLEALLSGGTPQQVATVNIDFVARAQADPWLKAILRRTAINLVDGTPLMWALRALGYPVPQRVAGSDLVPLLVGRVARSGRSIYILGGTPAVAAMAARRMLAAHPGLQIAAVDSPATRSVDLLDPGIPDRVRRAKPTLLLVALGNPKQEYWLDLHLEEIGVPVAIGIGGTLDLLAGRRRRAPVWMQRCGLEWLMRLMQEPIRLGPRYARDSLVFASLFPRELRMRGGAHG